MLHSVTINGREDAEELSSIYGLGKTRFASGETVTFYVKTMTDTDYRISSAQVGIRCEEYISGGTGRYSFVMPDTDVEVEIASRSSMVNLFVSGSEMPAIGMMAMGMMSMKEYMNSSRAVGSKTGESEKRPSDGRDTESVSPDGPSDRSDRAGKPKFCGKCGAPAKGSDKFCRECGAPLPPKE